MDGLVDPGEGSESGPSGGIKLPVYTATPFTILKSCRYPYSGAPST
jgi:hypothetical protein